MSSYVPTNDDVDLLREAAANPFAYAVEERLLALAARIQGRGRYAASIPATLSPDRAIYVKGLHSADSLREIASKIDGQATYTRSDLEAVAEATVRRIGFLEDMTFVDGAEERVAAEVVTRYLEREK